MDNRISKTLLFIFYLLFKECTIDTRVFLYAHLVTTYEDAGHITQELFAFYGLGLERLDQTGNRLWKALKLLD